jgi:GNAT superfamily N-acetyltransferase
VGENQTSEDLVNYTRIDGASQHSPAAQQQVDRATEVLSREFGDQYASPERIRAHLSNPENVILTSEDALAIVLAHRTTHPRLWLMWVSPARRGKGLGSELLTFVITNFAAKTYLRLDCPAEREGFYRRHGFHTLLTAQGGRFCYMAGPADHVEDVLHLLPAALR